MRGHRLCVGLHLRSGTGRAHRLAGAFRSVLAIVVKGDEMPATNGLAKAFDQLGDPRDLFDHTLEILIPTACLTVVTILVALRRAAARGDEGAMAGLPNQPPRGGGSTHLRRGPARLRLSRRRRGVHVLPGASPRASNDTEKRSLSYSAESLRRSVVVRANRYFIRLPVARLGVGFRNYREGHVLSG